MIISQTVDVTQITRRRRLRSGVREPTHVLQRVRPSAAAAFVLFRHDRVASCDTLTDRSDVIRNRFENRPCALSACVAAKRVFARYVGGAFQKLRIDDGLGDTSLPFPKPYSNVRASSIRCPNVGERVTKIGTLTAEKNATSVLRRIRFGTLLARVYRLQSDTARLDLRFLGRAKVSATRESRPKNINSDKLCTNRVRTDYIIFSFKLF